MEASHLRRVSQSEPARCGQHRAESHSHTDTAKLRTDARIGMILRQRPKTLPSSKIRAHGRYAPCVRHFPDMTIQDTRNTTDSIETESNNPRTGIARALFKADPETPIDELDKVVADVEHWVCKGCGRTTYNPPRCCKTCDGTEFEHRSTGEA